MATVDETTQKVQRILSAQFSDVKLAKNGFSFEHHDEGGLRWAIEAALVAYRDPKQWQRLIHNGMAEDFSWDAQGKLYELVYARLTSSRRH